MVKIGYRKIRGRGPGAPERRYGADGLFQISISDQSGVVKLRKGLPFQSKMNWRGKKTELYQQATVMESRFGGGLVVDFAPTGYMACTARAAVASRGSRPLVEKFGSMRPLGQILSRDFLDCTIGTMGLYFDTDREEFEFGESTFPEGHIITTAITISGDGQSQ